MTRPIVRDEEILAQIPAARRRARVSRPLAAKVRYQRTHRCVHVTLTNGATLVVPIDLIASLRRATDAELADVGVGIGGVGLRWERLDEDLSIAGLARIALGRQVLLSASGAAGGASRTAAKVEASRANGLKGGRPRKVFRETDA
jgi:hypothetical protein